MKGRLSLIVGIGLLILCVVLGVPAFRFLQKSPIRESNRLIKDAREQYLKRQFPLAYGSYKILVDSLGNTQAEVGLNYANSAFLSADALLNDFYRRNQSDPNIVADSSLLQLSAFSREQYYKLIGVSNKQIASNAANQLGYSLLRGNFNLESDSILFESLEHFKVALRANPQNDSARYNYELIKKVIDFPETILSETRALIAQKKYRAAAALLESGMRRDPRLRKQQDFMERLRTVIQIDSLQGRSI